MARSKMNSRKLFTIFMVLAVFLILSGVIAFVLLRKPDQFAKLTAFPIDSYMDGKDLWSHEDFKLEGRVDNVILRSASGGKLLVALQPTGSDLRLPILLEKGDGKIPVQREQKLVMKVNLGRASQIQCTYFENR